MKLPFFSKKSERPAFTINSVNDDAILILRAGDRVFSVNEWTEARPDAGNAISQLFVMADAAPFSEGKSSAIEIGDDNIRFSASALASLPSSLAAALEMPPPTAYALDIRPVGSIDQDTFHLRVRWVRPGGGGVRATLQGALLTGESGVRRIPDPLWTLFEASQALTSPLEKSERFRALAALRAAWPQDPSVPVETDGYLRDLRVHYASAVSLKLRTLTPDRTDFDPILFGSRNLVDADAEGRVPDEDLDNVLTPASQKLFAEDRFRRESQARSVYVLRDGEYVFIDASLRPALAAVRRLQDKPENRRRAFILNPRQVLREELGEDVADTLDLDRLFVETEQFSARVAGVDIWRAPVLPWLTPSQKNVWLPERFGLRIGDDYFVLPPKNVDSIIQRLEQAQESGATTIDVAGLLEPASDDGPSPPQRLPVTDQVRQAVASFEPFARGLNEALGDQTELNPNEEVGPALNGKYFLIVRENLEEVEFEAFQDEAATSPNLLPEIAPPKRLATSLKPHQVEGFDWLARSLVSGRSGALLADDMGLGKTLQALALMAWLQEEEVAGRREAAPILIVAPTGLLGAWREEITRHLAAPYLGELICAFGSGLRQLREEDSFGARDIETGRAALNAENWRGAGVVLTTYETLRDYHFSFARTRFGLIVYDEIQKLKNPVSQLTRAAKTLNAGFILGMTGTPVENRLQDLWSIMDVIAPGLLGASRSFERTYPPEDRPALTRLKSLLMDSREGRPAYMLRRLKSEALKDMPAKHIHYRRMDMPPAQATAYRDLVIQAAAGAASGSMGKGGMLTLLASMRGVSLHPVNPRDAPADLEAYSRDSARLAQTLETLKAIASKGEKALVFVEDLAMQDRLAGLIQSKFQLPTVPMRINGSVPGQRRQEMVRRFQNARSGFDVMILSPKAGGVGITLTAANHVIHLSRWWNPAVEDQATDRVFRIGQQRDVHVYLPIAEHPDPGIRDSSFDIQLDRLINRKRQLTRDLFLPAEPDDGDLADLFREVSLGAGNSSEPKSGYPEDKHEAPSQPLDRAPETPPEQNEVASVKFSSGSETEPKSGPANESTTSATEPDAEKAQTDQKEIVQPAPSEPATVRLVLSLPQPLASAGIRLWRVAANAPRPTDEVLSMMADREIVHVRIIDPYALALHRTRSAQARFIGELRKVSRSLDSVTVEYAPEAEADNDESVIRREFNSMVVDANGGKPIRIALERRSKRARDDDFHDRFVDIDVRHAGGAIRRHQLVLGRGVEALFDQRRECTVTYAPPSN